MLDFDAIAPNFTRAQQRWPNAPNLNNSYMGLKECHNGAGTGLVEQCKAFLETVCITVMQELHVELLTGKPTTAEIFTKTLKPLGLENSRRASKLDKVLSGFNKLNEALNEMRNEVGTVAHGKDGFLDAVTIDYSRAFLHTTDVLVGVVLNAYEGVDPDLVATREPYERFPHLNTRIDQSARISVRMDDESGVPIVIFEVDKNPDTPIELRVEASRLLYGIDRQAYVEVLKSAALEVQIENVEEDHDAIAEAVAAKAIVLPEQTNPIIKLTSTYDGELDPYRDTFVMTLNRIGEDPKLSSATGEVLLESLLSTFQLNAGLDWKQRENKVSKLRVSQRRVLQAFGLPIERARTTAEQIINQAIELLPDSITIPEIVPDIQDSNG